MRALTRWVLRQLDSAYLAGPQVTETPTAYLGTYQAQGRKTDGRGHATNLPVAALTETQLDPAGGHAGAIAHRRIARPKCGLADLVGPGRPSQTVTEPNTVTQGL